MFYFHPWEDDPIWVYLSCVYFSTGLVKNHQPDTLPETNSSQFAPEKWMVGIRSFPFRMAYFQSAVAVSFREWFSLCFNMAGLIPQATICFTSCFTQALEVKYPKQWLGGASDVGSPQKGRKRFEEIGKCPAKLQGNRNVGEVSINLGSPRTHTEHTWRTWRKSGNLEVYIEIPYWKM